MVEWLVPVAPVLIVLLTAGVTLIVGRSRPGETSATTAVLPVMGLLSALAAAALLWQRGPDAVGLLETDTYAAFFHMVLAAVGLFAIGTTIAVGRRHVTPHHGPRHQALLLLSLAGMMVAASARDLITAVLAIEVAWGAGLVLIGLGRHREAAMEAAFKSLVLGAFSVALWLYGVALTYAITGTTRLDVLAARTAALSLDPNALLLVALVLILGGCAFVVSAVPFHAWAADASSGADAVTAGWLTTGLRLAGGAVCLRVLLSAFEPMRLDWLPVVSAAAGVTMIVGAVTAVGQSSVRRLAAQIGVAHAGYLMVGVLAASPGGKAAVLFELVSWGAANLGVFAVLAAVSSVDERRDDVRDFTGLGYQRPVVAAVLTFCLGSLAGLPPTAGFVAKWLVLGAAIQEGLVAVAVLMAVSSVVLAFACARLVVLMYMTATPVPRCSVLVRRRALIGLMAIVLVIVSAGAWPGPLLSAAMRSVASIF